MSYLARVAIITRTKNRTVLLERAFLSVLNQTYPDWFMVVVNDGGDPEPVDRLVQKYASDFAGRIAVIHHERSMGMEAASNAGIAYGDSEYIVIHDDDDSWAPTFLKMAVPELERNAQALPSVQGVITYSLRVLERIDRGTVVVEHIDPFNKWVPKGLVSFYRMLEGNMFPPISFLFRRQVIEKIGCYRADLPVLGDWEFNLRFLLHYDIYVVPHALAFYHHRVAASGTVGNSVIAGNGNHELFNQYLRNDLLRADMQGNSNGLGMLMNMTAQLAGMQYGLNELSERLDSAGVSSGAGSVLLSEQSKKWAPVWTMASVIAFARSGSRSTLVSKFVGHWRSEGPRRAVAVLIRYGYLAMGGSSVTGSTQALNLNWNRKSILSLDVFDTCLLRRVGHPTSVFDIMEQELAQDADLHHLAGGTTGFRYLRIRAEQRARERLAQTQRTPEVNFDEIYAELARMVVLSAADIDRLKTHELELERRLMVGNPQIQAVMREAVERGLQVVYISDMYLPREFIAELLRDNGFAAMPEQVFVSGQYRKSKSSGELYELVSHMLGVPLRLFLHMGDNLDADVQAARKHGITAYHYEKLSDRVLREDIEGRALGRSLTRPQHSVALAVRDAILGQDYINGTGPEPGADFWTKLGYARAGNLFLGFTLWLLEQCRRDKIDTLIFLARDGKIMKECFDLVRDWSGAHVNTLYMYASRRALVFPSLLSMDEDDISFLAGGNHQSVRTYLERCGLDPVLHEGAVMRCGFASLDQRVETFEDWQHLRVVFQAIFPSVLRAASEESRLVLAYFDQMGLPRKGNVGLVDIGWLGSMQEAFEKLSRLSGRTYSVTGYYVGVHEGARPRIKNGQVMKGYLTTVGQPDDLNDWIMQCVELLEFLFLAPHGTCIGFEEVDGVVVPKLDGTADELENMAKATAVQNAVLEFFHAARPMFELCPKLELDPHGAFFPYAQVIRDPTADEAEMLGNLTHVQGFGQSERAYIARPERGRRGSSAPSAPFWRIGFAKRTGKKIRV